MHGPGPWLCSSLGRQTHTYPWGFGGRQNRSGVQYAALSGSHRELQGFWRRRMPCHGRMALKSCSHKPEDFAGGTQREGHLRGQPLTAIPTSLQATTPRWKTARRTRPRPQDRSCPNHRILRVPTPPLGTGLRQGSGWGEPKPPPCGRGRRLKRQLQPRPGGDAHVAWSAQIGVKFQCLFPSLQPNPSRPCVS